MRKSLKRGMALIISGMLLLSLTACGEQGGTSTTKATNETNQGEDKKEEGETKISFFTSQSKFKEEYKTMAAEIKKDHNITVDFQVVPDNEYYSLLKVKLSTSEVPDVFEYNFPTQNVEIGASNYCEDLSNESWVTRIANPDLIKDPSDGKIYALPKESSSSYMAVYYNKKVLSDMGIENPQPKTYEEFLTILNTIKEKDANITPLYMTSKDTWTTQIFMSCGYPVALGDKAESTFESLLTNKSKWTDIKEMKDIVNNYSNLIKDGYVNKDHLSSSYDMAPEKIAKGDAAMYLTIESFASDVASKYPDTELGAFIIPYGDNMVMATGAYVQGLFVPKAGKQIDKAKEFLNYWSDPKYQNIYYKTQPGFPAFTDVDGGAVVPCVQKLVDDYINTGKYTYQLNDVMAICSTIWPDLWNYYIEVISGTKTTDEMFETWQKQYVDFMQQQQLEGF